MNEEKSSEEQCLLRPITAAPCARTGDYACASHAHVPVRFPCGHCTARGSLRSHVSAEA